MVGLNIFKMTGDLAHLFGIVFLLFSIFIKKSSQGISAKSQLLYLMVFIARYCDVFVVFTNYYNTCMKMAYILIPFTTCFLLLVLYRKTYQKEEDTVRSEVAVFGCFAIAIFNTYDLGPIGIMKTFSESLEALALIPQFFLIFNTKKVSCNILIYLAAMGTYTLFYSINWICSQFVEDNTDPLANVHSLSLVGLFLFLLYSVVLLCRGVEIEKEQHFIRRNIFFISQANMGNGNNVEKDVLITDK